MLSRRPYLLRAMYQWMVDAGLVPHVLVDASLPGVTVPQPFVESGKIVLNLAPGAVEGLVLGNEEILCNARFGGTSQRVCVPIAAVRAIYARESGEGMLFNDEEETVTETSPEPDFSSTVPPAKGKPSLKVIK